MDPRLPQEPQPTAQQLQGKAIARAKLEAMHKRARRIRRAIAGTATALFLAAFLAVYVQLASGNDPALLAAAKHTSSASLSARSGAAVEESSSAPETPEIEASSGESSSSTESESTSTGDEASTEESPSPVRTSQS